MKNAVTLVIVVAMIGAVAVAVGSGPGSTHEIEGFAKVDDAVQLDRSRLLERASDAPDLKAARATTQCGPLSTLLGDGGSAFIIGFGSPAFWDGIQWNAGSDFPTSWFPFTITNVRAWAGADQGASHMPFAVRQIGGASSTGVTPVGTTVGLYSRTFGVPIAAGGFSAAVLAGSQSASGPRIRPVYRCATGTAVAPQQANQWAWAVGGGTAGNPFFTTATCSGVIGAGGPYPFMLAINATASGANVPVELMTFQID